MRASVSLISVAMVLLSVACTKNSKDCLAPGQAFENYIDSSFEGKRQFSGFQMVEMSDDFVERWEYSGYEIRFIIAAWPEGWDTDGDGPDEADIAVWIAESVDPPANVYSADGMAASPNTPWVGLEIGMDLLDSNVLHRPITCTLDQLEA